jgi:hypothetical protein
LFNARAEEGLLHIIGEKLFLREREEVMFLRGQEQRSSFFSAIEEYSFSFNAHAELFSRAESIQECEVRCSSRVQGRKWFLRAQKENEMTV